MGCLTCVLFWVAVVLIVWKIYLKLSTGWCRSNVCLVGKTAIVTGANAGIGYETAADFAKRGARVILACRDPTRGQDAVERIIKATNNENVIFKRLDLSSFASVRKFADDIKETETRLDILVNNAGAGTHGATQSEDRLLLLMQTNYFGPFLLTNLLLDFIKKTPNSRIVNVSSMVARFVRNFDVHNLNSYPHQLRMAEIALYTRSKVCNILFTIELAERLRGTGVTTYSLHPGAVVTKIDRKAPTHLKCLSNLVFYPFFKTAIEGAQTSIFCSVTKDIEALSGEHFDDCHVVDKYKVAQDPALPKELWKISELVVGLKHM